MYYRIFPGNLYAEVVRKIPGSRIVTLI